MHDEADLALTVARADQMERQVADEGATLPQRRGERERVAVLLEGEPPHLLLERRLHLLARPRLPVEVACHLGQRVDGGQRLEIALAKRSQHEPLGLDRLHRTTLPPARPWGK